MSEATFTRRKDTDRLILHGLPKSQIEPQRFHVVIRRDGRIDANVPIWAVGDHCKGQNATSIGVCLEMSSSGLCFEEQLNALRTLVKGCLRHYGITEVKGAPGFTAFDVPAWLRANKRAL